MYIRICDGVFVLYVCVRIVRVRECKLGFMSECAFCVCVCVCVYMVRVHKCKLGFVRVRVTVCVCCESAQG